ncbi:MAG: A/G-specific adenine glycosylase [Lachnospiraceae bacterium]|nr:A/G-specific adenine glycosylase [Lachnospiraceae bacterium]
MSVSAYAETHARATAYSEAVRARAWAASLAEWFRQEGRTLPWREDTDPYHVWVSEIMLQQTRIEAVMGYYARFMEVFPAVEDLARAPEDRVLKLWEGLGYYSRARNLHKAAKLICERGSFPETYQDIRALPGIGDYTAGAIAAIAFGLPETAVDGNVMRVVSRLELLEENVLQESSRKKVKGILKDCYPFDTDPETGEITYRSGHFVQGLMELGEVICLPSAPRCSLCPVQEHCKARMAGREEELPLRVPKTRRRTEELRVLLLHTPRGMLLFRRPEGGVLGGLWELPNVLPGETFRCKYGLDLPEDEFTYLRDEKHIFTHITWHMRLYSYTIEAALQEPGEQDGEISAHAAMNHAGPKELFDPAAAETEVPEYILAPPEEVMLPTAFRKLVL